MKKMIFLAAASVAVFAACNNAPTADKAIAGQKEAVLVADGTPYPIDSASTVTWTGTKPGSQHHGTFKLKEGSLLVKDNSLTGGSFLIDMSTLSNLDLAGDADNKVKLEGHLKSPDFFDVTKYPTAKFEITAVEPFKADTTNKDIIFKNATHTIKGNLTLKDSTKNISFPAKVTVDDKTAVASAEFNINRTDWGINYKGPNNPQDWVISKTVNIKLTIAATKK